ncbi:MAG: fructose-6-phosphate aldolase [Clostridia bacterium]|nr:fructose-6-phosphate aldolase [Clostridia bacterium]MBO5755309.1 fructose-6-phosphate aldolase [Clostridia bacterium]
MLYILDTANLDDIRHCNEFYPLAGVTTNPSIISKEKTDFWKLVKGIREVIGDDKMLHVQTTQKKAEDIVAEAQLLKAELGGAFYVKIPISEEGLKATMMLKKLGVGVTVTAIFTPAQALLAATAGADFVAPYANRLDNIIADGCGVVAEIVKQIEQYGLPCRVLAASFRNAEQVHRCASVGCHSVTVSADILRKVISHPMTDAAVADFEKDWQSVYGDKTIRDFK